MGQTQIQEKPYSKIGKTLSISELSELVSEIRKYGLDIDDFQSDTMIEETIEVSNVALVLDIEVKASSSMDDSDYSREGYGSAFTSNEDGYFKLKKTTLYYNDEEVEFDELSMKVINSELSNLEIFE